MRHPAGLSLKGPIQAQCGCRLAPTSAVSLSTSPVLRPALRWTTANRHSREPHRPRRQAAIEAGLSQPIALPGACHAPGGVASHAAEGAVVCALRAPGIPLSPEGDSPQPEALMASPTSVNYATLQSARTRSPRLSAAIMLQRGSLRVRARKPLSPFVQ